MKNHMLVKNFPLKLNENGKLAKKSFPLIKEFFSWYQKGENEKKKLSDHKEIVVQTKKQ